MDSFWTLSSWLHNFTPNFAGTSMQKLAWNKVHQNVFLRFNIYSHAKFKHQEECDNTTGLEKGQMENFIKVYPKTK